MSEPLQDLGGHIKQAMAGAVTAATVRLGELMLDTTPDKLIALLTFLRDDPRCLFKQLVDFRDEAGVVTRLGICALELLDRLDQRFRHIAAAELAEIPATVRVSSRCHAMPRTARACVPRPP